MNYQMRAWGRRQRSLSVQTDIGKSLSFQEQASRGKAADTVSIPKHAPNNRGQDMTRDELKIWLDEEPERDAAHKKISDAVYARLRGMARDRGYELPEQTPSGHQSNVEMIREACGGDSQALREVLRPIVESRKVEGADCNAKTLAAVDMPIETGTTWFAINVIQGELTREVFADVAKAAGVGYRFLDLPGGDGVVAAEIAVAQPVDRFIFRAKLGHHLDLMPKSPWTDATGEEETT